MATPDIDRIFADLAGADSPGCAVAVVRSGVIETARSYGLANVEHRVPITAATVFDIGSTSKQFTAACILLLAREGKVDLDADIRAYLPQFATSRTPATTVRQLVHHTSGIRDYITLTVLAGRPIVNDYTEDEIVELLARQRRLDFKPGTKWSYSNSGYFLLGEIVRAVSGASLRSFAAENIFGPLGMADTRFLDDFAEVIPNRASGYSAPGDGSFRLALSVWDVVGDGAVWTTVDDLAIWDRQFYECDLPGGNDFIADLTTPGHLANGKPLDYAFGLVVGNHRGARIVQHGGSWAGFRAQLLRFPEHRLSVVVLANLASIDAGGKAMELAELLLADVLSDVSTPGSTAPASDPGVTTGEGTATHGPADLAEFEGAYRSAELDATFVIERSDGGLRARAGNGTTFELRAAGGDEFAFTYGVVRFRRRNGRVGGFVMNSGRATGITFTRKAAR